MIEKEKCKTEGCELSQYCRGYCNNCYTRLRYHNQLPKITDAEKIVTCHYCRKKIPKSEAIIKEYKSSIFFCSKDCKSKYAYECWGKHYAKKTAEILIGIENRIDPESLDSEFVMKLLKNKQKC